jgi:hypothetical protein
LRLRPLIVAKSDLHSIGRTRSDWSLQPSHWQG